MKLSPQYDFIIAGGGLAGLSLAGHLVNSPLRGRSILIIDKDSKEENDRTWSFWLYNDFSNRFSTGAVHQTWRRLRFVGEGYDREIDLGHYRYQTIRGLDFYRLARLMLAADASVTFLQGTVTDIEDGAEAALVTVDGGQTFAGRWLFDSLNRLSPPAPDPARYHYLKLHFKGWEIETAEPVFDPQTVTLLDFRGVPQKADTRFFYVLPYSEKRALVEFTLFSTAVLSPEEYRQALQDYLADKLGVSDYRVVHEEQGAIPITDQPFPRQTGRRIMAIGAKGGRIKPTTGYAFTRIQQDSAAIVESLVQAGHPFNVPADSRRYRLYDTMLLNIMIHHGAQIKPIFTALFKRNPIERVLRFLDEEATLWENVLLIATLPRRLFLQVLFRLQVQSVLRRFALKR